MKGGEEDNVSPTGPASSGLSTTRINVWNYSCLRAVALVQSLTNRCPRTFACCVPRAGAQKKIDDLFFFFREVGARAPRAPVWIRLWSLSKIVLIFRKSVWKQDSHGVFQPQGVTVLNIETVLNLTSFLRRLDRTLNFWLSPSLSGWLPENRGTFVSQAWNSKKFVLFCRKMLRVFTLCASANSALLCVNVDASSSWSCATEVFFKSAPFCTFVTGGTVVKKNVVWENVSENLLVKFLHSSFTPKKVFVRLQGTNFLFWLVLSRMKRSNLLFDWSHWSRANLLFLGF